MVQEAVEAIKDGLVDRDRPFVYVAESQSFNDRPIRYDLLLKNLGRRVDALQYFGAHGNVLVDRNMCQYLAATTM